MAPSWAWVREDEEEGAAPGMETVGVEVEIEEEEVVVVVGGGTVLDWRGEEEEVGRCLGRG